LDIKADFIAETARWTYNNINHYIVYCLLAPNFGVAWWCCR